MGNSITKSHNYYGCMNSSGAYLICLRMLCLPQLCVYGMSLTIVGSGQAIRIADSAISTSTNVLECKYNCHALIRKCTVVSSVAGIEMFPCHT